MIVAADSQLWMHIQLWKSLESAVISPGIYIAPHHHNHSGSLRVKVLVLLQAVGTVTALNAVVKPMKRSKIRVREPSMS